MKTFNVTITSKNKTSISNFFLFFNSVIFDSLIALITYFQKNVGKKKLTVLTSPHANKSAQEQFECRFFKKQLVINTIKTFKYLIFFKKLNYNMFSDIGIKLKCRINNKGAQQLGLKTFNPNRCKFRKFYSFRVELFH
jgi:ribosomal protein S10